MSQPHTARAAKHPAPWQVVIGGPGAFVIPIRDKDKFIEATRTKLVLEIAGRVPEGRAIPASAQQPRVSCTLGERLWQERWGN